MARRIYISKIVKPLVVIKTNHRKLIKWNGKPTDAQQRNAGQKEDRMRRKITSHSEHAMVWIYRYYGNVM